MLNDILNKVMSALAEIQAPWAPPAPGEMMVMAPPWLMRDLGIFFLVGAAFYIFRMWRSAYLARVNGYVDGENELWHFICLVAMAACITPAFVPMPVILWLWVLPVGTFTYLVRAFTYGKKLPHNKQWYDFAHAAMLFGMWWMFAHPLSGQAVTVTFAAYWGWFASYYVMRLVLDLRKPHWLGLGQDIFHLVMALTMLVMTLWPMYLMVM